MAALLAGSLVGICLRKIWLYLFMLPQVNGFPLHTRGNGLTIDPSSDAWAEIISGIGPLILLLGERTTKQLLRSVRTYDNALSIGTAPLGLLAVFTSLIRFCGVQKLRAFIGYELEARAVAGIEYTQVNCGGVHAEMLDGHLIRSTSANPASQVAAVSFLKGRLDECFGEVLGQIRECARFESERLQQGIPRGVVDVRWVLGLRCRQATEISVAEIVKTLADVLLLKGKDKVRIREDDFRRKLAERASKHLPPTAVVEPEGLASTSEKVNNSEVPKTKAAKEDQETINNDEIKITTKERSSDLSPMSTKSSASTTGSNKIAAILELDQGLDDSSPQLTFMYTLDAVSEFLTRTPTPKSWSLLISILSLTTILAIYILALRHLHWQFSVAWLLLVLGYIGIVIGVSFAAMIISTSCTLLRLENRSNAKWTHGVVNSVKNTDSMETTGSAFLSSEFGPQILEVVWLRPLTRERALLASTVACGIVVFFLCHYIGLRSLIWWVALGELGVCLLAAFARSLVKGQQARFEVEEGVKLDKRCCSTGVISMQKGHKVGERKWGNIDARAYSALSFKEITTDGESIAWEAAKLCFEDAALVTKIQELTGMLLHAVPMQDKNNCDVLVAFDGGLLVSEGLAFPNCQVMLSFHSSISALGTPTALLARGIMRQPEWVLDKPGFGPMPLGQVYVLAIDGMIDWWTMSEDRNDMSDLQKNLQWCFVLINISFFLSLLELSRNEEFPLEAIEKVHCASSQDNKKVAQEVFEFLQSCL
ncbi:hypothetical protein BKA61DRAFT_612385 [Leptodontidium sp. MPI-SDFR-AT-0119]|nr:hypothetical protein BKA61DRAFT_612385 [Leptodontidium sp. MPI-SDFR-AT-0119]